MDIKCVNAFVESVYQLYETMLSGKVKREDPRVVKDEAVTNDIVALIGLSGSFTGSIALLLSTETANKMLTQMIGVPMDDDEAGIIDGVSELVNMIAGNAKAKLADQNGTPMELSLPTVISGAGAVVSSHSRDSWLEIPFASDLGDFRLRLSLDRKKETEKV